MARTSAISILKAAGEAADLSELYGIVIENIQKSALSGGLKSQAYTGDPKAGSVEFKRFTNAASRLYGTARNTNALKGDAVTAAQIPVNLAAHKEIVEECARFDLDTLGVEGILARRIVEHINSMVADLDGAFFGAACAAATQTNTDATDPLKQLEALILDLETVENNFTRGVPRDQMSVVCTPAFYSSIRQGLDVQANPNVDTAAEEFGLYHGVRVYSSLRLSDGIDAISMADGAVAQPVVVYQYGEPEKIPMSNDYAVSLFYDYGTKALTTDLIFKLATPAGILGELDVTSAAGENSGGTKLTVDPVAAGTGNSYVYKLAKKYEAFDYDDTITGWTAFTTNEIAAGANTHATVAEITAGGKARARGIAKLTKKA